MKAKLFFLFTALCTAFSLGQSSKLFDAYKIPTYAYHTLQLSGQDFLSYIKNKVENSPRDNENLNILAYLTSKYISQSPMYSGSADLELYYNYSMQKLLQPTYNPDNTYYYKEEKYERALTYLNVRSSNDFYIKNEKGLFAYGDFTGRYDYYNPSKEGISTIELSAGAGYGRIVGLRTVVQAYILGKEISAGLSDDDIQKLSEIIEKRDNGYYQKFRDDADIEFYNDINEVTKKPEHIAKAQQVLNSALYKTSERMDGWRVRAGLNFFDVGGDNFLYSNADNLTDFQAKAEYACPIGFNMQAYLSAGFSKNLDKGEFRASKASFTGRFSIDHSYTWSSSISVGVKSAFPEDEVEKTNYFASLTSNLVILNSLSVYGALSYDKSNFFDPFSLAHNKMFLSSFSPTDKTERTEFHLGFRYYIL